MTILDAAVLAPLLVVAGALRKASGVLAYLAGMLDPPVPPDDSQPPPSPSERRGPGAGSAVVITPEAGQMLAAPTPRLGTSAAKPLAGSLAARMQKPN